MLYKKKDIKYLLTKIMVNIVNEQQQANKELLNEIETLKKQLSNKKQETRGC